MARAGSERDSIQNEGSKMDEGSVLSDPSPHTTRRAPHMERYITISPTVMEGYPDAQNVFLQVTNQRFCISPLGCETMEQAEWLRDMFCIALDKIVQQSR